MSATGSFAADTSIINVYDVGGNLISGDGQYYEYNDANQLVKVRQGDQNGTVVAEYFYDSTGQRVKKIENGVVTYYVGKHFEKQVGGSNAGSTSYYFAEGGERVAKKGPSGSVYYYHLDHLDGVNVVTDAAGTEVARSDYLPFGDTRSDSTGSDKYSYTGKEKDKTDLYYFEARYNSPANRHFTQADVADPDFDDPQDLNRYAYVGNNPLSFVDYDGFKKKKKAKLSKREKYLIAHGRDPDKDKTPLKTAKKQEKAKEKAAALWAKQHPASILQSGAGYSLSVNNSVATSAYSTSKSIFFQPYVATHTSTGRASVSGGYDATRDMIDVSSDFAAGVGGKILTQLGASKNILRNLDFLGDATNILGLFENASSELGGVKNIANAYANGWKGLGVLRTDDWIDVGINSSTSLFAISANTILSPASTLTRLVTGGEIDLSITGEETRRTLEYYVK